ncbi:PLP-dependent transferase [Meredithblackwellia eburnea MCA 4105]
MSAEPELIFKLNENLVDTNPPPIPKAGAWALLYKATPSSPLLNLAQGVPGAPPPEEFQKRLGEAAALSATTTYGDLRGDKALREGLARDVNSSYGITEGRAVKEEEITLTAGCNLAFYATMVTIAKAGDEVIVPTPWYFNNEMTLHQLGITTVPLVCSAPTFLPSPTLCQSLITPRTRGIILVSPNNPTGAIYPPSLLKEFSELAKKNKLPLILDETYREFIPPSKGRPHDLFADDDWRSYLIQLFSFSKSYAIPGHRLGSIIASLPFQRQIHKTMDCLQICPARPAQLAVTWAIEGTREWRQGVTKELVGRAEVFVKGIEGVEGWEVATVGAYFAYVRHPFEGFTSEQVGQRLAQFAGIIVLPGTFFGPKFDNVEDDRYLRFSIANVSSEVLHLVPVRLTALNKMWDSLPPL